MRQSGALASHAGARSRSTPSSPRRRRHWPAWGSTRRGQKPQGSSNSWTSDSRARSSRTSGAWWTGRTWSRWPIASRACKSSRAQVPSPSTRRRNLPTIISSSKRAHTGERPPGFSPGLWRAAGHGRHCCVSARAARCCSLRGAPIKWCTPKRAGAACGWRGRGR